MIECITDFSIHARGGDALLEAYKVSTAPPGYWDSIKEGRFPDCDLDQPWKEFRDLVISSSSQAVICS